MHDILQRLSIIPPKEQSGVIPAKVLQSLPAGVTVFSVDDAASDTAAFSTFYGIELGDCANTIVLRFRKGGTEQHVGIVSLGSRRLDVNGAVKTQLGAQRITFAQREIATELTGMEFGGITAFGLPSDWPILVDSAVMERAQVVMGAGIRMAKLLLDPKLLLRVPNVYVARLTLTS